MRSWLAEVLRVTANHLSPIKPIVMKQDIHVNMPDVAAVSEATRRAMTVHTFR